MEDNERIAFIAACISIVIIALSIYSCTDNENNRQVELAKTCIGAGGSWVKVQGNHWECHIDKQGEIK